jgi:hypothetical protein
LGRNKDEFFITDYQPITGTTYTVHTVSTVNETVFQNHLIFQDVIIKRVARFVAVMQRCLYNIEKARLEARA